MVEIVRSSIFDRWLSGLADRRGRAIILTRIDRLAAGSPGDAKAVGGGISELRIQFGPGYRVYYTLRRNKRIILLLCGGSKSSQARDIARAKVIASAWED
jgi:putative addiction module killer protein